MPFIIYADFECLSEHTSSVSKHISSGFSISTILPFKSIENKHDAYKSKDYMKNFCESLKEHAMEKINFKKKQKWSY